jgi:20S proteasome alpha/beta subunit
MISVIANPARNRLPNKPFKPYIQPAPKLLGKAKSMTIATGFCCSNGVILAADTLITMYGGTGKSYESKIFEVNFDLNMFLTYTGDPDFAKEYVNDLSEQVRGKTPSQALTIAKELATKLYTDHYFTPQEEARTYAAMLLTLQDSYSVSLYSITEKHFVRVQNKYVALGIGNEQAQAFFNPYFKVGMDLRQCERIARYGIFKVKQFVQGCGGDTEVRQVTDALGSQSIKTISTRKSNDIDNDFEYFDRQIGKLIIAYSDFSVNQKEFRKTSLKLLKNLEDRRKKTIDAVPKALKEYFKTLD